MAWFRVELDRVQHIPGQRDPNPFLIRDIWSIPPRPLTVRSWEFEAKNEKEVRKLLDEAFKEGLSNVRGFRLRSITKIDKPTDSPSGVLTTGEKP